LQDQADYLKKLAECKDIAEAVKYRWSSHSNPGLGASAKLWSMFDHLRTQSQSGSSEFR
jgi:hypothetical protein